MGYPVCVCTCIICGHRNLLKSSQFAQELKSNLIPYSNDTLMCCPETSSTWLYIARSAFTDGILPTLWGRVCALQGLWGHWGALIMIDVVSKCCQCSPPTHSPPIHDTRDITGVVKNSKTSSKNTVQQSLLWNTSYKTDLLIQQIWCDYNVAQESHGCFNISKWYFSKYKMC